MSEEDDELEQESRFTKENREKKEMVKFNGMARTVGGKLTRTNYFNFLKNDLDDYSEMEFSPQDAKKIHHHLLKMSTGSTAMVPMYCGGEICPFKAKCPFMEIKKPPLGKQCHPPLTPIMTTTGVKQIQDLNPEKDKIVSYAKNCGLFRKNGRSFKIGSRDYKDSLVMFQVESNRMHSCTTDHISIASWNEKARGLFAVYLMQKGDFWRVGKVKLFRQTGDKWYSGLTSRANQEQCDRIWILDVLETNTEALLAEEYFSVHWQIGKACFIDRPSYKKTKKQDGLYKWVTQEQLDTHHRSLLKPLCHYASLLKEHGLDIRYPFWDRSTDYRQLGSIGKTFEIRACNVIAEYMDMVVLNEEKFLSSLGDPNQENRGEKEKLIKKYYIPFEGKVYSLHVDVEHTYVASGIVTHNCLVEVELMKQWIMDCVEEFDIDPQNFTEVAYANELAEIMILERRLNMNLAKVENAELIADVNVGVDREGDPIVQKVISPFMELKEKLANRRSRIIKLMVGDRQEKYKKEAALKVKLDADPSGRMAAMRTQLETLSRQLDTMEKTARSELPEEERRGLSPQDIIDGSSQ